MKKVLLNTILLAIMLLPLCICAQDGVWLPKSDFTGGARNSPVAFSINNKGYVGTGFTDVFTNDFWQYDPITDTWAQVASLPGAGRTYASAFAINNKGYVGFGIVNSQTTLNDLWEYDGISNSWLQKASCPGNLAYDLAAFSVGEKGYVGAGLSSNGISNEFWKFDPLTNGWTRKSDFPGEYRFAAVGLGIGTKGYIGTGTKYYTTTYERLNDFWQYDPATNAWTQKANVGGLPRYLAMGFTIGGTGYIGCGVNYSNSMRDVWAYDTLQNTWRQVVNLPVDKSGGIGVSINGKGYFGLSYNTNDFWQLDTAHSLILAGLSKTTFCSSNPANFSINYTAKGDFAAGNTFSLKLFDKYNSYFQDTITIGQVNSTTSGTINATIPATLPLGSYYVLQIVAGDPAIKSDVPSQFISIVDPVISVSPNISNPVCSGNNGGISLDVSGGDGNYQYVWDDASTGNTRNTLAAGDYSVIVTNPGCSSDTKYITLANVAPAPPSFDPNSHIAVDSSFLQFHDAAGAGSYSFIVYPYDQTDTLFNAHLNPPNPAFVLKNLLPSSQYVIQSKSYCPGFTDSSRLRYTNIFTPCTSADPTVFGNNVWKVYAFTQGDVEDYGYSWLEPDIDGVYIESSLSFDTRNRWDATTNPTQASGYNGCGNISDDYFSWSAKRKGFPCGEYAINIPGHADEGQLFINGVKVWEHIGCCDTHDGVWQGLLGPISTVELRGTEGTGEGYGAIQFNLINNNVVTKPTIISSGPLNFCSNSSVMLTSSSATGNTWSTGATTKSIVVNTTGNYSVTVTGGGGCTGAKRSGAGNSFTDHNLVPRCR